MADGAADPAGLPASALTLVVTTPSSRPRSA